MAMNADGPRAPALAIGAATVAVVMSLIALVVVVFRTPKGSDLGAVPFETSVGAADVLQLNRDTVELVEEDGAAVGVRVTEGKLRDALGLKLNDRISAFSGRAIKRESDIADAVLGASSLDATVLYVDIVRDGEPIVLRWKLDDNLRASRKIDSTRPPSPSNSFSLGGNPYTGSYLSRDPLLDTIKKVDDMHYEIPRSTIDKMMSDPIAFMKGARVVPGVSMGRAEGLKLYAIRPNSLFAAIGLSNGDLIREVNGFALDGSDKALEVFTKLRDATSLEITLTRRGREETLRIEIR